MTVIATPAIKWELVEDLTKGTDEYGKTAYYMSFRWVRDVILWVLDNKEQGRLRGNHNIEGMTVEEISVMVMEMTRTADKWLFKNFSMEQEEDLNVGQMTTMQVLKYMHEEDEVLINEDYRVFPNWEVEVGESESQELDGVTYPNVTRISPNEILHLNDNPKLFAVQYPAGDFNKIVTTARHLLENKVDVQSQEFNGSQMYLYEIR